MPIPQIAGALSAIGSILAKKGLDLLGRVFNGTVDKGTEKIAHLIQEKTGIDISDVTGDKLTEEQWVKLKEFEYLHQEQIIAHLKSMNQAQLNMMKIEQLDRSDARAMQRSVLESEDKIVRQFIYWYTVMVTILTFAFIFASAFCHPIDNPGASRVIDTVLGFLLGVSLSAIIQFFFGSSHDSSSQQKQIDHLAKKIHD